MPATGTPSGWIDASRPETVKLFSKMLWGEVRKKDAILDPKHGFAGYVRKNGEETGQDGFLFYLLDEPMKSAGDQVTVPYDFEIENLPGVTGNEILEGKEGEIETEVFTMVLDKQRHGVETRGEMVAQRVHFDAVQAGKRRLANWWKTRKAVALMNHLCANEVLASNSKWNGLNTIQAIDSDHIYRPGGSATDQAVQGDTTLTFDVDLIDELVTIAELLTPPVVPFNYKGNDFYALFLHSNQVPDMRADTTQWYATMQNALQGGARDDNPLFTRALGKWRNTLLFSDPYICQGVHSTSTTKLANTRRSVFCGRGAAAITYGRHYKHADENFRWFSSTWDHGDKYYCSASLIWGCKAASVPISGTQTALGRIVLTTYAAERVTGLGNVGQPA